MSLAVAPVIAARVIHVQLLESTSFGATLPRTGHGDRELGKPESLSMGS